MPTMFTQESAPAELRELTDLYCRDGNCTDGQKCPCDFAGLATSRCVSVRVSATTDTMKDITTLRQTWILIQSTLLFEI